MQQVKHGDKITVDFIIRSTAYNDGGYDFDARMIDGHSLGELSGYCCAHHIFMGRGWIAGLCQECDIEKQIRLI